MSVPTRFEGVSMEFAPSVHPESEFDYFESYHRFTEYLGAIVLEDEMERLLDPQFLHVDGALLLDEDSTPRVDHVVAVPGKETFIHGFRDMINRQIVPNGLIRGAWLPLATYRPIEAQVQQQLPDDITIPGKLLGAAAVRFPYRLRPGGDPLDLPGPLHGLLGPDEVFTPLAATGKAGDPRRDSLDVDVIQAVYGDKDSITSRVGLVWNGSAVPLAVRRQLLAHRSNGMLHYYSPSPMEVAEQLIAASGT